jgi:hypothetical protein
MTAALSSSRRIPAASLARRTLAACSLLALLGSGCDLVQGFQDAGDALFPEERTHLSAPGLRLVAGGYREIRFASGADLYLLARKPDDEERNLYAMLYSAPRPCAIPNVASYFSIHLAQIDAPAITYHEEDGGLGSLHFTDARCTPYPHVIENARPVDGTPDGFVIWAGPALSIFNPVTGINKPLSPEIQGVVVRAFAGHHLVFSNGKLVVFAPDWRPLGEFGQNVRRAERAGSSLFYEDDGGIHRLHAVDGGIADTVLTTDGCELVRRDDPWVHYYSPCSRQKLVIYHEPSAQAAPVDIQAAPRHVKIRRALGSAGTNPATQPFWFFYLRDVNVDTDLGTLVVRAPDGSESVIGSEATLDLLDLIETPLESYGYALVSVTGNAGTYRYFTPDGQHVDLATRTIRDGGRLIVDYDGVAGNLAAVSRDELRVVAEGVPWRGYEYQDRKGRWTALYHGFDGTRGALSILDGSLDGALQDFQASGRPPFELRTIARDVGYFRTAFLDFVLPGIIYLSGHDPERDVGLLEYRNLELGFTAQIAAGVSDFIVTADDVLYSVPYGDAAGIWLLQAK